MYLIKRAPPEPPKKKFANVEKIWHKYMQKYVREVEDIIMLYLH